MMHQLVKEFVWFGLLSDSEQTPLLCASQFQSPRAMATSEMLTVDVFVGDAEEECAARRARGGGVLHDALMAEQQHGPFCGLAKPGPAWW